MRAILCRQLSSYADDSPPERIKTPYPEDFEGFVESIYREAYCFAYTLAGNQTDACDLTQQAFYLAQTHEHQLRDVSKRKSWLFTILRREYLRTKLRNAEHPHTALEFCENELPQITIDHAAYLDGKDILLVLRALPEDFRMPLALFYIDQLSYKEIAAILEIPIGTVMSRLARGKDLLRQNLEQARTAAEDNIVPMKLRAGGKGTDG